MEWGGSALTILNHLVELIFLLPFIIKIMIDEKDSLKKPNDMEFALLIEENKIHDWLKRPNDKQKLHFNLIVIDVTSPLFFGVNQIKKLWLTYSRCCQGGLNNLTLLNKKWENVNDFLDVAYVIPLLRLLSENCLHNV